MQFLSEFLNVRARDETELELDAYVEYPRRRKQVVLSWHHLSFAKKESFLRKMVKSVFPSLSCPPPLILDNLEGSINEGELTGLMGPSGAGKSTLLKCLTRGRSYSGFSGKIQCHAQSNIQTMKASFITQDENDHLFMNLTVVETLRYASKLKNSSKVQIDIEGIVGRLIKKLDLCEVEENLVENCSGGQKKRLAIGLELCGIDKPNFLLLDEPTSGLDSFAGHHVVTLLRKLAVEENIAIVTTIHQPSFKILSLFHSIFVLTKAGNCIYNGSPAELADVINRVLPNRVEKFDNPADVIIEIASTATRKSSPTTNLVATPTFDSISPPSSGNDTPLDDKELCVKLVAGAGMSQSRRNSDLADKNGRGALEIGQHGLCSNSAQFGFKHLWQLLCRTCKSSIWRQQKFLLIRLVLHSVVACVLALLYDSNIGRNGGCRTINVDLFDPQNCSCSVPILPPPSSSPHKFPEEAETSRNVKFQFFSLLFLMFAALMPTVLTFPAEIKVFLNEHRNGWYTTSSYYFSKTMAEIPFQFLFPFFYTYFLYSYSGQIGFEKWTNGLPGLMSSRYANFLWITILSCFIAQGLGFLIGILCVNSMNISIVVSSSTLLFLFLFSGFFVKIPQMAPSTVWFTNLSFIRFSFESLLVVLYGFERCGQDLSRESGMSKISHQSIVLETFNLHDEDLPRNVYWLIGHLVCIRLVAFFVLKLRADPKSRPAAWKFRRASEEELRVSQSEIPYCRIA